MHSSSVFQAYCRNHPCAVLLGSSRQARCASLVTISSRMARILLEDPSEPPACGESAALAPRFLDGVQVPDIEGRIEVVSGKELQLSFSTPLTMPGSRLCQITRR